MIGEIQFNSDLISSLTVKKIKCSICNKNISKTIKFICSECHDVTMCLNCLIQNPQKKSINNSFHSHDYHILDNLKFSIFSIDWTAEEELKLIRGIEIYGIDNWKNISKFIDSKTKIQCESHYYTFYYKSNENNIPQENDLIIKSPPNNNKNYYDFLKSKQNRDKDIEHQRTIARNYGKIPTSQEYEDMKFNKKKKGKTTGKLLPTEDEITIEEKFTYDIKRKEFDIEPFNDAELEIAHLDFNSSDSEEDTKEKIKTLLIYNRQLKERDYQKEFVINNQLESMESIINKTEILKDEVNKEICKNLSKLARFTSKEIFTRILLDAFKYRELRNKKRILGMILQEKNSELNQIDQMNVLGNESKCNQII